MWNFIKFAFILAIYFVSFWWTLGLLLGIPAMLCLAGHSSALERRKPRKIVAILLLWLGSFFSLFVTAVLFGFGVANIAAYFASHASHKWLYLALGGAHAFCLSPDQHLRRDDPGAGPAGLVSLSVYIALLAAPNHRLVALLFAVIALVTFGVILVMAAAEIVRYAPSSPQAGFSYEASPLASGEMPEKSLDDILKLLGYDERPEGLTPDIAQVVIKTFQETGEAHFSANRHSLRDTLEYLMAH